METAAATDAILQRLGALEDALGTINEACEDDRRARATLEDEVGALRREVDVLRYQNKLQEQENAILRQEIAALKYGGERSTPMGPRKRPKAEHLAFTSLGNDTMVHIASFVGAEGIAGLAQTGRHFGRGRVCADGQVASLAEELAARVLDDSATDYEESVLVGRKKIGLLHALELMRLPLHFKQLIGDGHAIDGHAISYPRPGDKSIVSLSASFSGVEYVTAIGNYVMRTGKHYVTFCLSGATGLDNLDFGVIRPIKDWDKKCIDSFDPMCCDPDQHQYRKPLLAERTEDWGNEVHCCFYNSHEGKCFHANWSDEDQCRGDEWEGMEPLAQTGQPIGDMGNFKVGLLLDLNSGTLSVFKDGRKLGVMKEGLTGAYCWCFYGHAVTCEVKIERGMPPATRND